MNACPAASNPTVQHTRATDYTNHGCRCDAARRDRERRRKQRHLLPDAHLPITGTRRRLQALMVLGWSQNDLNSRLGRARSGSLGPLIWTQTRTHVTRDLHDRVLALYDELWDTPGPSVRTARAARARGWLAPLWWDDDLIDDPLYTPFQKTPDRSARRLERLADVAELSAAGRSTAQIAEQIGIHPRQVDRDKADLTRLDPAIVSPLRDTVLSMRVAS